MAVRMAIEVARIRWDTDGAPVEGLPSSMSFEVEFDADDPSEMEINDAATEHMSQETGWCVEGFAFTRRERLEVPPSPGM